MKYNAYAIFDKGVQAYMRPFFMQADGQAMRLFGDMAVDAEHDIGKHPEDYALFRIGEYEEESGALIACEPRCLARAHELAARSRIAGMDMEKVMEPSPGQIAAQANGEARKDSLED